MSNFYGQYIGFGVGGAAAAGTPFLGLRGVFAGGEGPTNTMDYVTISTTGDATDFGNLSSAVAHPAGCAGADSTRGIFGGGYPFTNAIDYITIATTADAADFGCQWPQQD